MKRKNASISNADILYNYVHNNCPRRFFIDFYGVPSICPHYLCYVDKLSSMDKFIIFSIFNNSLFYKGLRGYLPQQFLYFLPLPQVVRTPIFIILIIFIILLIFQGFTVLVIYYIYNIYSIFVIINIPLMQTNRKQCLHSFTEVIIFSIYNKCQCAFSVFAHLLYYKYLFLSMDLSDYSYLIISSIISDFVILSKTSVASRLDFSVLEI